MRAILRLESTGVNVAKDAVPLAWTSVHLKPVKSCSVADREYAMRRDNVETI